MTASSDARKTVYLEHIRRMRRLGLERAEEMRQEWEALPADRRGPAPRPIEGMLAIIDAFLYEVTGEQEYASSAGRLLAGSDYALYEYVRAYRSVREAAAFPADLAPAIEDRIARTACRFLSHHVEWGAMNHATNYVVDGLAAAALVLPDHPRAGDWSQLSDKMLATSWGQWGIEDSQNYCPIWFMPLVQYADLTGRREFFDLPTTVYYFHYFLQLLCPAGSIPEFGDGGFEGSWERYVCLLERGAAEYGNGQMKWAARRIFETFREIHEPMARGLVPVVNWAVHYAARLTDAYRWCDDTVEEEMPTEGSRDVLEDAVGKKVVFRSGWRPDSTYLLLNYMDVPTFGVDGRDMLRTTIPVEAEKTHHGHAEENAICMLMSRGTLLLGESGYRETDTTGPTGEWRADTYHNRLVARPGLADPQTRLLPFLLDTGRYRFVQTQRLHFHRLRSVDVSRTRLTDVDAGYRWDRILVYARQLDRFVLFDAVKVLRAGDRTFASLLYSGRVLEAADGLYRARLDSMGTVCEVPNPKATDLVIHFPEGESVRHGCEQVRRAYQTQVCVYQVRSENFAEGDNVAFVTVLAPVADDEATATVAASVQALRPDEGRAGVGVRLDTGDRSLQLCACLDPEAAFLEENLRPRYSFGSGYSRYGELETDARFSCLEVGEGRVAYSVVEATRLVYAGRELFAPAPIDIRQDEGTWQRPGAVRWRAWEGEAQA